MKKIIVFLFSLSSINILSMDKKEDKIFKQLPSKEEQLKIVRIKWKKVIEEAARSYYFKISNKKASFTVCQFLLKDLERAVEYNKEIIETGKRLFQESNSQVYKEDIKAGIIALEEYLNALYDLKTIIKTENLIP